MSAEFVSYVVYRQASREQPHPHSNRKQATTHQPFALRETSPPPPHPPSPTTHTPPNLRRPALVSDAPHLMRGPDHPSKHARRTPSRLSRFHPIPRTVSKRRITNLPRSTTEGWPPRQARGIGRMDRCPIAPTRSPPRPSDAPTLSLRCSARFLSRCPHALSRCPALDAGPSRRAPTTHQFPPRSEKPPPTNQVDANP